MRKLMILAAVALVLAIALPAARWAYAGNGATPQVTGGAEAQAGVTFSMAINAIVHADGTINGKIQYSRDAQGSVPALSFHARVRCSQTQAGGAKATAAGPVTAIQNDPAGLISPGQWACAAVLEGDPDRVRVRLMSESAALQCCVTAETSFPGVVVDGNYTIRELP